MYRVTVRDRIMIAHSFTGEVFGPAQQVHGATYVVEAEFATRELDAHGLCVDIALAHEALAATLAVLNYKDLDSLEVFAGINTTTEYLAGWIWEQLATVCRSGGMGRERVDHLAVTLRESDVAWASYDAALD